jgi:hypothetical protein
MKTGFLDHVATPPPRRLRKFTASGAHFTRFRSSATGPTTADRLAGHAVCGDKSRHASKINPIHKSSLVGRPGSRRRRSIGALGQAGPDFYANKQIRMIIGHPPGNDYDLAARFLAVKTRRDRCLKMCAYPGAKAGAAYIRI